jgi:hypothetical protein
LERVGHAGGNGALVCEEECAGGYGVTTTR